MLTAKEWPEIEKAVSAGELQTFRTKKEAESCGKQYGWKISSRFVRRFEIVWIVAKKDFQPDYEGDIKFDVIRTPMLRWDNKDGIKFCPVVKFRKHSSKEL